MTKLINIRDIYGNNVGFRQFPDFINAKSLVANTAELETIPDGYNLIILSYDANIWAKVSNTMDVEAEVSTDTTDGTASELNPSGYSLTTQDNYMSVISDTDCKLTISYYKV